MHQSPAMISNASTFTYGLKCLSHWLWFQWYQSPVTVSNPGGQAVVGGFQQTIDSFFNSYWKQSFLQTSGVAEILRNPIQFKQNLPRAKTGGRAAGYDVGYRWIAAKGVR